MSRSPNLHTDYRYSDRESKAKYVWLKYQPILRGGGKILDVGADECYLKQYLAEDAEYWGIGLGGHPDQQVDLEQGVVPFPDSSFDCVLCLDVLEHLENIHQIFDELCRVARRYVIISLPNPWGSFWSRLRYGYYRPGRPIKFYNLPLEKLEDRHKWFFSIEEAEQFILYRSGLNGMRIVQLDVYHFDTRRSLRERLRERLARALLLHDDIAPRNLIDGSLWAVLEKLENDDIETNLSCFEA